MLTNNLLLLMHNAINLFVCLYHADLPYILFIELVANINNNILLPKIVIIVVIIIIILSPWRRKITYKIIQRLIPHILPCNI